MVYGWMYGLVAALSAVAIGVNAEHWAVIVAGSKGYWNYRHQADACHAYHVVRRHGIPAENVILMMYDDVANAPENPFPGKLYNVPANMGAGAEPMEVYAGCHVDYRGDDVTPQNFINVLLGDADAVNGKKVLGSGPDDRVFVNFVDHGADGVVVFPDQQLLTAKQLNDTMSRMFRENRYKELVFYVEACESGSMFTDKDVTKLNAFVTTAANASESSFGFFCPPMDIVHGQPLNTCLGDLYSVNWMRDSDKTDLSAETLKDQFKIVKQQTNLSHVLSFGNPRIRREIVGNFQSNYDQETTSTDSDSEEDQVKVTSSANAEPLQTSGVDAHDVSLVIAFYKYLRSKSGARRSLLARELIQQIQQRESADVLFAAIQANTHAVNTGHTPSLADQQSCRDQMYTAFADECGHVSLSEDGVGHGFTSYSLQYSKDLGTLCNALGDIDRVRVVLRQSCQSTRIEDDSVVAVA